ncbi:hypothetical protein [Nannocystis radixulma]|uniref:Uncharacterized protein n=1 Tax=Nannocystis radixulma TaxID=2995305 RepID=A0ABT5B0Z6_9BACT|nr:hypothetical protein [Nannocystis radixulma]MDC0667772.1 hypothetical protein [Nannocystis radixulma]
MDVPLPVSELLAGRPSLAGWRRLTAALDAQTDPAALARDLDRIEAACAGWPDALRRAPGRWVRDRFEGRAQPRLRVTRAIDLALMGPDIPGDRLAWADAPELAAATVVRIFDDRLGDAGLARWLSSTNNLRPVELALASGITDRGAAQLAADPRREHWRSLALFRDALGPDCLAALIAAPMPRLRRLLLGRNLFGEPGARALAGATAIADLELLDLDCDDLDGPAARALCDAPLLAGVRTLNLSNNPLGADGCAALADCPQLADLEVLHLHDCRLDDAAAARLLRAPWLPRLRSLSLSANALSMATIHQLAERRDLVLDELDICHNPFDAGHAESRLRSAPQLSGLRRLCL